MLNKGIKRLALFSIFFYIFLILLNYTGADLFADRTVLNNKFKAITLDFSTGNSYNNLPIVNLFHTTGIIPGGYDLGAVKILGVSETSANYRLNVVKLSGDDNFCNNLNLEILNRNFRKKYDGKLIDLSLDSNVSQDSLEDFIFVISLDNDNEELKNKLCEFNFNLKTYRDSSTEKGGIFAERRINNIISSSSW